MLVKSNLSLNSVNIGCMQKSLCLFIMQKKKKESRMIGIKKKRKKKREQKQ